jgi:hypothetical protein
VKIEIGENLSKNLEVTEWLLRPGSVGFVGTDLKEALVAESIPGAL